MTNILKIEECSDILQNALERENLTPLRVIKIQISTAENVIGFLGEYYNCIIDYMDSEGLGQQLHSFIKSPLKKSQEANCMIFHKEAKIYADLLPKLQMFSLVKWSAKCYLLKDHLLIMEDLKYSGMMPSTRHDEYLDEREMHQLLRGLAAIHSSSVLYELNEGINIGERYNDILFEITISPNTSWFVTGINALIELIKTHTKYQNNSGLIENFQNALDKIYAMVNPSKKYYNVFCHRDVWQGNVFFTRSTLVSSAIFVDFQTARYCPPSIDIIFAIYMNMELKERTGKEIQYLEFYFNAFAENLKQFNVEANDIMTKTSFIESYNEFRLVGCVYLCLAATILRVPKDMLTDEYKYKERSIPLLQYMRENGDFRAYMEQCLAEVVDLIQSQ